ncbi:carboxymuconolactone decarboxylase family protein [Cryptosporangium arvum]|uniref:carboxymuconolactone decarboxylase family protein n=1 Tax=Cryptosporangium arvum TaxID=80871 RepID=UPI001B80252C|nr:carboxymuconolactone decarboxylase family protein [Cryptosporangium arvum]
MDNPLWPAGRLRRLSPAELDDDQRAVYRAVTGGRRAAGPQAFALVDDQGRLTGPFNAMLLSPPVGAALQSLGEAVRYETTLSDRARELAILVVAAHWGSTFEREAHEAVGRRAGLTDDELGAVRTGTEPHSLSTDELAALRTTRALLTGGGLEDAHYDAAVAALGERGLFELTTLVGYYGTLALQLRVFAGEG